MYDEVAATFYSVEFLSRLCGIIRIASRELGGEEEDASSESLVIGTRSFILKACL